MSESANGNPETGAAQGIKIDLSEIGNNLPASGISYYRITSILRCGTSAGPEALPIRVLCPRTTADVATSTSATSIRP